MSSVRPVCRLDGLCSTCQCRLDRSVPVGPLQAPYLLARYFPEPLSQRLAVLRHELRPVPRAADRPAFPEAQTFARRCRLHLLPLRWSRKRRLKWIAPLDIANPRFYGAARTNSGIGRHWA